MRHRTRLALAITTATLLSLVAGAVAAGSYADVGFTDGMDAPPTAGEEREIGFTLLQHGVTPVDFGEVTVTATAPGAAPVTVQATPLGDGRWVATVTFPAAGDWQLRVTHTELETPAAVPVSVGEAAFAWPASLLPMAAIGMAAILVLVGAAAIVRRVARSPIPATDPTAH
jgi:YtkA-like